MSNKHLSEKYVLSCSAIFDIIGALNFGVLISMVAPVIIMSTFLNSTNLYLFIILFATIFIPYSHVAISIIKSIDIKKFQKEEEQKQKIRESGIFKIDQMSGVEFEYYLKVLFEKDGYQASTTPKSNDYGADLILSKSGIKTVIQAKRSARNVGNKAVQEVIGARHYYKADYAMVVTNSSFTKNAIALAESSDVKLVDREELIVFSYRINQY